MGSQLREETCQPCTSLQAAQMLWRSTSSAKSMQVSHLAVFIDSCSCVGLFSHYIYLFHAGEWISGATCNYIANFLAENYGKNEEVTSNFSSLTSEFCCKLPCSFFTGHRFNEEYWVYFCALSKPRWLCGKFAPPLALLFFVICCLLWWWHCFILSTPGAMIECGERIAGKEEGAMVLTWTETTTASGAEWVTLPAFSSGYDTRNNVLHVLSLGG